MPGESGPFCQSTDVLLCLWLTHPDSCVEKGHRILKIEKFTLPFGLGDSHSKCSSVILNTSFADIEYSQGLPAHCSDVKVFLVQLWIHRSKTNFSFYLSKRCCYCKQNFHNLMREAEKADGCACSGNKDVTNITTESNLAPAQRGFKAPTSVILL